MNTPKKLHPAYSSWLDMYKKLMTIYKHGNTVFIVDNKEYIIPDIIFNAMAETLQNLPTKEQLRKLKSAFWSVGLDYSNDLENIPTKD